LELYLETMKERENRLIEDDIHISELCVAV